jgi:hypothetical protein
MQPDSTCGECRHALKWHNPCSKCPCPYFVPSSAALKRGGARLPDGSVTGNLVRGGRVTESGIVIPKGKA